MSRYTEIVILCEDRQQEVFARYFLLKMLNVSRNRIRIVQQRAGQGAAEHFVRSRYPTEVGALRRRNHLNICLIVIIDADMQSVDSQRKQLDQALRKNSLDNRQPNEKIGIFIPKRNIETWIYYLSGQSVNENDAYSHLERESICKEWVEALASDCRNHKPLPDDAPESLKAACSELLRILPGY